MWEARSTENEDEILFNQPIGFNLFEMLLDSYSVHLCVAYALPTSEWSAGKAVFSKVKPHSAPLN